MTSNNSEMVMVNKKQIDDIYIEFERRAVLIREGKEALEKLTYILRSIKELVPEDKQAYLVQFIEDVNNGSNRIPPNVLEG